MENRCREYYIAYIAKIGNNINFGGMNILQSPDFQPITNTLLQDAVSIIKKANNWDDSVNVTVVSWQRFEAEDE